MKKKWVTCRGWHGLGYCINTSVHTEAINARVTLPLRMNGEYLWRGQSFYTVWTLYCQFKNTFQKAESSGWLCHSMPSVQASRSFWPSSHLCTQGDESDSASKDTRSLHFLRLLFSPTLLPELGHSFFKEMPESIVHITVVTADPWSQNLEMLFLPQEKFCMPKEKQVKGERTYPKMCKDERWEVRVRFLWQHAPALQSESTYPSFNNIALINDMTLKINTIYPVYEQIEKEREAP